MTLEEANIVGKLLEAAWRRDKISATLLMAQLHTEVRVNTLCARSSAGSERRTSNSQVDGSNPSERTKDFP